MQFQPITIIGLGGLWIATLAGAFYLGKDQLKNEGKLSGQPGTSNPEALTPGGASKGSKNAGAKEGQGSGATNAEGIPLKQLLAQLKGSMRLGGMQNPNAMMKAMALLDQIRPEDFQEALSEAENMTDQQMKMLVHMTVLGKWAEQDGPAAMKYAEEHSKDKGMLNQMAKMSVASAWAEKDPEAVWKWNNDQKDKDAGPMGGQMVLMSLFSSMAAKDPEMAFKRLAEIEGTGKQMALMGMFQSAMFDDKKRADILKQVDAMPDKSERDQAKMSMMSQWMMLAPDDAIAYVKTQPEGEQDMLRTQAGQMFMMSNPKKGAAFILEGATDENRAQKYSTIIGSWAHQDPNAAGAWLNEQPRGRISTTPETISFMPRPKPIPEAPWCGPRRSRNQPSGNPPPPLPIRHGGKRIRRLPMKHWGNPASLLSKSNVFNPKPGMPVSDPRQFRFLRCRCRGIEARASNLDQA